MIFRLVLIAIVFFGLVPSTQPHWADENVVSGEFCQAFADWQVSVEKDYPKMDWSVPGMGDFCPALH